MRILDSFESLDDLSNIRCFSNVTKGIKPFLCHEIKKKYHNKNMVIILENNHQINEYYEIFTKFFREKNILKFPAWDNIPFEEISPSQNILNDRFKSLSFNTKISDKKKSFVLLANLDSLLQMVPKKEYLSNHLFKLDNTSISNLEIPTGNPLKLVLEKDLVKSAIYLDQNRAKNLIIF